MNKRLFVAGLPFSTTSDELKTLFAGYGNVVSATVITDRDSGRSKGFGFVEMEKEEEAQNVISKLDGTDFGGRKLIVNEAKPREERPRRDGGNYHPRSGGFRGQRKSFGERREGGRGSFGRGRGNSNRGGFRGGRH